MAIFRDGAFGTTISWPVSATPPIVGVQQSFLNPSNYTLLDTAVTDTLIRANGVVPPNTNPNAAVTAQSTGLSTTQMALGAAAVVGLFLFLKKKK